MAFASLGLIVASPSASSVGKAKKEQQQQSADGG
jgi:hypothetical protein